ncbi:murein L,D-transpeptidase [Oceanicaulis sp. LC35]|uniref:L,D-transpeptidase family protein n=1 Tax=Oceanicaulis sp. LC35 TaxID=3349635 RepID=UPI003F8335C0
MIWRLVIGAMAALAFEGACLAVTAERSWTARWTDAEIVALSDALSEAWTHGLDPSDYPDPQSVRDMPFGARRDEMARAIWFDYAEDLAFGVVDPRALDADWTAPIHDVDLLTAYAVAREGQGIYESLEALAPSHPDYQALRSELIRRLTLVEAPIRVPPGDALSLGDEGPRVDTLRARLAQLGLLPGDIQMGAPFDGRLESAVMRFQTRYNLAADGEAGASTLAELNAGDARRINQIRANLERWRWLPAELGERHIRVNIADYRLEAWENGEVARTHQAMIGRRYSRTPVFSEDMSIIEINPYWLTPTSLGQRWVRAFRTSPAYALSQGYRLVDLDTGRRVDPYQADWANRRYRVIQAPGPNNAMGRVKFLFPNVHNVYIHDTPHRELFANAQRDDSSGCVRVENPEDLAIWVLSAEGWSAQAVREAFDSGETRRIRLRHEVPVHILYFTAVSDAMGQVRFVHDVYGRDERLVAALADPPLYRPEPEASEPSSEELETEVAPSP